MQVRDRGTCLTTYRDVEDSRRAAVIPSMFPSGESFTDPTSHCLGKDDHNDQAVKPEDNTERLEGAAEVITNLDEQISSLPLERCMRIMPHDQNSGAFFIAVVRKTAPFPGMCRASRNHLILIIDVHM